MHAKTEAYYKSKIFHKNFFKSWKPTLKTLSIPIEKLELCDFSAISKYLENINASLSSDNEELKGKNGELISILLKVSDVARVGVECNKKGY